MAVTHYNMRSQVEEFIKVAEKASFDAKRAHERIDALPAVEPPAAPAKGERGPQGLPGKDAAPAKDGRDAVGINGINGRDGRDGAPGPDTASVLAGSRAEISDLKAKFAALSSDFNVLSLAFTSQSKKSSDYYQWLLARAADRIAKNDRLIASKAGKQ